MGKQNEPMFLEVGERGTVNSKNVKAVLSDGGCGRCKFIYTCDPNNKHERPTCFAHERPDKKSIIYV
ncbi:MAG: hypothetical protein JZU53_07000 [Paludibacter sp.]|nr:hypothetical protein [Paludibacter sp.]